MKILMMIQHFPPAYRGGAELQCWKQACALAARGHEVTIWTEWLWGRSARREVRDGVTIRRLGLFMPATTAVQRLHRWLRGKLSGPAEEGPDPFSADGGLSAAPQGPRRIRLLGIAEWLGHLSFLAEAALAAKAGRGKADVVHVHESHWLAGFGQWVAEQWGVPVFCKEACGAVLPWQGGGAVPGWPAWKRRRMRCTFIAMTPHIRRELEKAGIPAGRIREVPNGVELPEAEARPEEHAGAIYAGNFYQGAVFKAFDVLLAAWGQVHREEPELRLRLFGSGDPGRWKQVAEKAGGGDSVEFAGKTEELQGEFRKSGFLVLPSRVEGMSNVLLEAQAAGLPAVVSDIGGNVAVVADGENGLVVPTGDAAALAQAILRLGRSPELRARMGQAARKRMREDFSLEAVAARLEAVYRAEREAGAAGGARFEG